MSLDNNFICNDSFRTIFDLSPDPILIIKEDRFIDCNQAAVKIMGASSKNQLIKIHPTKISPLKQPDGKLSSDKAEKLFEEVYKNGIVRFEWLHTTINGEDLFVEVTLTKFETNGNQFLHVHWKDISKIKEFENESELNRKRFEEIASISSDWVWEVDKNGIYTYVSPRVKDFLGYEADEIIGTTPFDLMSEEEAKRVGELFLEYVKEQKPFKNLENRNIHKDGSEVILHTSGTPIYDKQGEFIGYRGTDKDVTKITNLIEELELSRSNLKQAQKLANIGHWELDLVNNSLYWSDEVYRIFGLKPQEFGATYEAFLEYVHPEDHEEVNSAYAKSVENKSSYQIIHRVITKQKELKFVEERCEHVLDDNGNVIKSIGTVHDITEKVNKDKQIYLSSKVFEYSTDAILISDSQNKIVAVNKTFTELTGYSLDETIGKNPRVISSGWGDKEFYQKMWNDISNKGLWQGEIWDRKKDGTLYIADQSIIAVKNKYGKVENYIGISHDITEAKNQEEKIRKLAYYDFLTKLPNRKLFKEEVDNYIKSSHYNESKFALMFLDLDNFKWVNDTLGHKVGDKVLLHVSKEIQAIINEDSIVGRLGGDEFVVLIPYNDLIHVSQTAQKIIQSVEDPITIDKDTVHVGWSIGISLFPDGGDNYDDLLKNADLAMYVAKDNGKNNYQYFNIDMNNNAHEKMQLLNHLKYAIKGNSFHLVYQPKIDCKKKNVVGAEALLRWNDKELGFVPPDTFIPVAEESGLIIDIGYWVIEQVFKDTKKLLDDGFSDFTIAINVSIKQLEKDGFIEKLIELLALYELESKYFELEITESLLMKNIDQLSEIITQLHDKGFSIAIDDFGTGYSSLQYLNKLKFHTLKIDKEFIGEIESNGVVITEAIMGLSQTMGFVSVAEGVETKEQAQILKNMGCNIIQGYLYSKPLEFEDFIGFCKSCESRY
jgi:diguanylate cyclase (GGDEF)-like protein/PAS domain S-box-containing protein